MIGSAVAGKWVWLLVGLLMLVAFAGCLGGGSPDPDDGGGDGGPDGGDDGATGDDGSGPGEDPGNTTSPVDASVLVYEGCSIQGLQMFLPAEFFAGDLPEGFEIASPDPAGELALLEVVGVVCPTVLLGDEAMDTNGEFRFHLDVVPPQEHENPDAVRHSLLLDSIHSNEEIMELYGYWGLWASPGGVSVSTVDAVAARSGQVTVETQWETFDVHSVVEAADESCQDSVVFRTFGFRGEQVTDYVDMELDATCFAIGAGSVEFEPYGTDPESLAFWLLLTGATSGLAFHSMDDSFQVTQTHTPLLEMAVAVSEV